MAEKIQLSQADRKKVWWRSQFLQGSWNYERMQNLGWAYSLIPAIKKLYTNKEDQAAALKRHLEFFNTHPYVAAPIMGVTLALEEEKANGTDIEDAAIQGVKIGMMGPLAGIGDPVFWFTVRPIPVSYTHLGAAMAPDASLAAVASTIILILGGQGTKGIGPAIALAVPLAVAGLALTMVVRTATVFIAHIMDSRAEAADIAGVERWHFIGMALQGLRVAIPALLLLLIPAHLVQSGLEAMPEWLKSCLLYTSRCV